MGDIELRDGTLFVGREPNDLDQLALDVTSVLQDCDIDHVLVAGYVAILAGRSRSTEDIDLILEPLTDETAEALAHELKQSGFWGSAMPLDELSSMLSEGTNIRVARDGEVIPNVELKYPSDQFDRASLDNAITARIGDESLPIGPLELQIAYKLYLDTQKDFEDAVHLFVLFEETLSTPELERWVQKLGVDETYERLQRA